MLAVFTTMLYIALITGFIKISYHLGAAENRAALAQYRADVHAWLRSGWAICWPPERRLRRDLEHTELVEATADLHSRYAEAAASVEEADRVGKALKAKAMDSHGQPGRVAHSLAGFEAELGLDVLARLLDDIRGCWNEHWSFTEKASLVEKILDFLPDAVDLLDRPDDDDDDLSWLGDGEFVSASGWCQ